MVAVLEQEPSVLVLGEERRRLPTLFDTLLHLRDVVFPFVVNASLAGSLTR